MTWWHSVVLWEQVKWLLDSPVTHRVKNLPIMQETWVQSLVRTQYSCLEIHGQKSLSDYSPWDHKEPDTTEQLTLQLFSEKLLKAVISLKPLVFHKNAYLKDTLYLPCLSSCDSNKTKWNKTLRVFKKWQIYWDIYIQI